jgi:hypothetical protein
VSLAVPITQVPYHHENGLKHLNITNDYGYCALFVVNTPVFDNSGVAHGVEHFVFRRSLAFPQSESLFQLTSLTDIKMNASTLATITYFHCQSHCQQTFALALNYMLNGILCPIFDPDDLVEEIHDGGYCGVIYRELLGAEQQVADLPSKINPDKCSQEKYQHGGHSSIIGQLSSSDLSCFHQRFYQACDITLITANADSAQVSHLIKQLPKKINARPENFNQQSPYDKTDNKSKYNNENNEDNKHQKKYSSEINCLIDVYHQWVKDDPQQTINNSSKSQNRQKYSKADKKQRSPIAIDQNQNQNPKNNPGALCKETKNSVIAQLTELSSQLTRSRKLVYPSTVPCSAPQYTLPKLFSSLYQQAQTQLTKDDNAVYIADQQNGLLLTHINITQQAQAHIASFMISAYPSFLAPRSQGHCYLIHASVIEQDQYLAIYSAFDVSSATRHKHISESLLQLSQDLLFINESLWLAKIKYCRAHKLDIQQVCHITPATSSKFLWALNLL